MDRKKRYIFIGLLFIFLSYFLLVLPNSAAQSIFAEEDMLAISTSTLHEHIGEKDDLKKSPFSIIEYTAALLAIMAIALCQYIFKENTRKMIFMTPIYYEANSI